MLFKIRLRRDILKNGMIPEDEMNQQQLERLKREIAIGMAQIEAGQVVSVSSSAELKSLLDDLTERALQKFAQR